MTNSYCLTNDEVLLLDGKVGEKVQKEIDFIKLSRSLHPHPIIGAKLAESITIGTYSYVNKRIRNCCLCGKSAGYAKYTRNSRNRYGHRKGETNYSAPLDMNGIEINPGFITITGYGTCCQECNIKDKIVETIKGEILTKNLEVELLRDKDTKFKKDIQLECFNCKSLVYQSLMGKLPALMGGSYSGKCPICNASQLLFGQIHKSTGKFRMLPCGGTWGNDDCDM